MNVGTVIFAGVARPAPDVLGFVIPVFMAQGGDYVAQRVLDGRVVDFEGIEFGEEFLAIPLRRLIQVGDPALYAVELEDGIYLGSLEEILSTSRWKSSNTARGLEPQLREQWNVFARVSSSVADHFDDYHPKVLNSRAFAMNTPDATQARTPHRAENSTITTQSQPAPVRSKLTQAISQLTESIRNDRLITIIGAGVSLALTDGSIPALSWRGLIESGLTFGLTRGKINSDQMRMRKAQMDSTDLDDMLQVAEFVGRRLDSPHGDLYHRWLRNTLETVKPTNHPMIRAIRAIRSAGIPIGTLNYDSLLEQATDLPHVTLDDVPKTVRWFARESPGILHLHGSWRNPSSCILSTRDYERTVADEAQTLIRRSLTGSQRILFIGCGDTFADPNFFAFIGWLKQRMDAVTPQHYALVKGDAVYALREDPAWQGIAEPVGYGTKHLDLAPFIERLIGRNEESERRKKVASRAPSPNHKKVLRDYCSFLIKDCGQMTIEGVRADMDAAQRRFDLEQLFVPREVVALPPKFSATDPIRGKKLEIRARKYEKPVEFGRVFVGHRRLALLAEPGGGKSLLLRRLAVAYADEDRRAMCKDGLPVEDLTPIMIRCREWREHIRLPIFSLLRKLSDIIGQPSLSGFAEALVPRLSNGRALLLIDGLDEIHEDSDRATFVDHLETFLFEYPRIRVVVTSREANFNLVEPSIARYCHPFCIAPLNEVAVEALCSQWSLLAGENASVGQSETPQIAEYIGQNVGLRQLAGNPLLLTMLLVVKQSATGLPTERVMLYERAVAELLASWNINGHELPNLKEVVPQLAYIAFQLMRAGKQTGTEKELLDLLEECRESVPQIRRYAKDTPYEFLKRLERSSLLIEGGHQMEGGQVVPFYEFRHLAFQEYLAAVAVVQGHYRGYTTADSPLTPLEPFLSVTEWKEVVSMTAAMVSKQETT